MEQPSSPQRCIYCLRDLPQSAFDRDHVVPQAFGTFEPNNPVVTCVCKSCNKYFGDTLELFLGRDGLHALQRLQLGLKPLTSGLSELGRVRLSFTVEMPGNWYGCHLEYREEDGELVVDLLPQVALARRDGAGWIIVTEHELADLERPLPADVEPSHGIRVFSRTPEMRDRLVTLLHARGIPFRQGDELSEPPPSEAGHVLMTTKFRIDPIIRRAIAKIAFNYLAWAVDPPFVLHPDFTAVRAYIRDGTAPGYELVRPTNTPTLTDDTVTRRQTAGHLVTVAWVGGARHLLGQVALFNDIKYEVLLARNFRGVWRDIRSGHHFDVAQRTVTPLIGVPRRLVPPPRRRWRR
jgi:hypothetical protein